MAAAAEPRLLLLGELLSSAAASQGKEALYLCSASLVLERVSGEAGGEAASGALLAGVIEQLGRAGEREGEGGEKGEGDTWECVRRLCQETGRAGEEAQTLSMFVGECRRLQLACCQLLPASLAAARACQFWRPDLERDFLGQFAERFWSPLVDRLAERVAPLSDSGRTSHVIKHLSLLHSIQEVFHAVFDAAGNKDTLSSLHSSFLCEKTCTKLAVNLSNRFPRALHIAYQQWWSADEKTLKNRQIRTVDKKGAGLVLKVGGCIKYCNCTDSK